MFDNESNTFNTLPLGNILVGEVKPFEWNVSPLSSGKLYLTFSVESGQRTLNRYDDIISILPPLKHGIALSTDCPVASTWQGENASYVVYVKNTGNVEDNVTLTSSVPVGWSVFPKTISISLEPREENRIYLTVVPPESVVNLTAVINLTANSSYDIKDNLTLYCNVMKIKPVIQAYPDFVEIESSPNKSFRFNYTVKEIGNRCEAKNLNINVTELKNEKGYTIPHSSFIYYNGTFNISKGDSKEFLIEAKISPDTPTGIYKGNIGLYKEKECKDLCVLRITILEKAVFDTDTPENPYPSISGTHIGTITPSENITVHRLYTYPCEGTGGHTEYVRIYGNGIDKNASWNGYNGDWQYIYFDNPFVLEEGKTYNYTIMTGSYPQIIHETPFKATGGTITCTRFIDANGRTYTDWIPAIRLE